MLRYSSGGSAIDKLSDVTDVSSTALTEGQVLVRSAGDEWVPTTQVLSNNSDVSSTAPTDGQVLTMVGSQWTPADGSATALSNLSDCFGSQYPSTLAVETDWDDTDLEATWGGGYICTSSNWNGFDYEPWMVFDGNAATAWRTQFGRYGFTPNFDPSSAQTTMTDQGGILGDCIQIELPTAVAVKAYKLTVREHPSEGERQVPLEWMIVGCVGLRILLSTTSCSGQIQTLYV